MHQTLFMCVLSLYHSRNLQVPQRPFTISGMTLYTKFALRRFAFLIFFWNEIRPQINWLSWPFNIWSFIGSFRLIRQYYFFCYLMIFQYSSFLSLMHANRLRRDFFLLWSYTLFSLLALIIHSFFLWWQIEP